MRPNGIFGESLPRLLIAILLAMGGTAAAETRSLLPHLEQIVPGVYVTGFADRYRSANCGWFALKNETWLVDLPRGVPVADYLAVVDKTSGLPARRLVLTQWQIGDEVIVQALLAGGIEKVLTSAGLGERLAAARVPQGAIQSFGDRALLEIGGLELIPSDGAASKEGAALFLANQRVLFAGPLVTHGPRAPLTESNTARWLELLDSLPGELAAVVPGCGSWGPRELLDRQKRFLKEIRRHVGYTIAQGRSLSALTTIQSVPLAELVWMPYDTPTAEDLAHVYRELTVPHAPFNGEPPQVGGSVVHALVLIGDQPHEPGHIEEGLRPAFADSGVVVHFTVDVRALSAENLGRVQLLVVLRDGLQRPLPADGEPFIWMTDEQQQAVVEFVERGGGFLNLHNSMGLYPADGPYLKLVGGAYTGHGPLERFLVEVLDRAHPVTRGVSDFSVADEQHAPTYDEAKVHLLLQSRSDDGKVAAAGWTREPGRGRLCHLASGHTRESLLHPMYQRLLRNAIDWCLRREPDTGEGR